MNWIRFEDKFETKKIVFLNWTRKHLKWFENTFLIEGSGCGSVGRVVVSFTRGLQFKSSHWQNLYWTFVNSQLYRKDKNKEKRGREWPFIKTLFNLNKYALFSLSCCIQHKPKIEIENQTLQLILAFLFQDVRRTRHDRASLGQVLHREDDKGEANGRPGLSLEDCQVLWF